MDHSRRAISNRHKDIISLINKNGFAMVDEMAKLFNVTPQTIRRDINFLDAEGYVTRYHGGAGPSSSAENVAYRHRKGLLFEEKKKIAAKVASIIPNKSSLFINIGTTTEDVAHALCDHSKLRIITNNLNVATILSKKEAFEVIVTGGIVRSKDGGITGESAIKCIKQFKVDIGIIGISGIDLDGTLLDFDFKEVHVARTIIENSRKIFLVADHSKFGRNAMVKLGSIREIDTLITDKKPPEELMEIILKYNINLMVD